MINDYELLKTLCSINSCSGDERPLRDFILKYIDHNKKAFTTEPQIYKDGELQDALVLVFGKPKTALFAHMDNIGFTVRYNNEAVRIGSPSFKTGIQLVGKDSKGEIEAVLKKDKDGILHVDFERNIDTGTNLSFKANFRETNDYVQCCYMDNRLGVFCALQIAQQLENGIIVFGCYEEHGGGSVNNIARWIWENFRLTQALICDITWASEGVKHGEGVAISLRDVGIPRKAYVNRILQLAEKAGVPFQLEVEESGGSDGTELQKSAYPIDWCFVGAPESNVHTPDEMVYKADIEAMIGLYQYLMQKL